MLALHEILQRFDAPKPRGKEYRTRCPAHDDRTPSLDIAEGDTGIVFRCRVGCETQAILAAVGLTWADVLPPRPSTDDYAAVHDYRDAAGVLRYQVVQLHTPAGAKKQFKQRRPGGNGAGAWIWDLKGVTRLPFRLPELAGHARVFVCEGEKDANRLWALGLPATCNSGGAGQWGTVESQALHVIGVQRVVLLQDFDAPGAAHVAKAATHLTAAGIPNLTLPPFPGVPATGGDVSDWLDLGHTVAELEALLIGQKPAVPPPARQVVLTAADTIRLRPVRWAWHERIALGTLCLVGGREGVGKSILAYTLAAHVTNGTLPGVYQGRPRAVIVAATEDSWEHTIGPRLIAAGADLARVFRVDIQTPAGVTMALSLPVDLPELKRAILETETSLIILDPLLSRLDTDLDTHKDADVRVALEPVVTLADETGCAVLGLIHVNKSTSTDPLTMLMGSRAFAAVARSVLFVMVDPNAPTKRLMGQAKNNLGRMDLPTLSFQITGAKVAETPEGDVWTGQLHWLGDSPQSIQDAIASSVGTPHEHTAVGEAADWLTDYLTSAGGPVESAVAKKAGNRDGHTVMTLQRARAKIGAVVSSVGYPRKTYWTLPVQAAMTAPAADDDVFEV